MNRQEGPSASHWGLRYLDGAERVSGTPWHMDEHIRRVRLARRSGGWMRGWFDKPGTLPFDPESVEANISVPPQNERAPNHEGAPENSD